MVKQSAVFSAERTAAKWSRTSPGASPRIDGTAMKAFEIHTFRSGNWKIDSVFDDRELAMFEAQRMDSSNRFPGVRVVEEIFDEAQATTSTRTIFRGGIGTDPVAQPAKKPRPKGNPASRGGAKAVKKSIHAVGRPQAKKKPGFSGPLIMFFVVVVLGAAAMFGLQYLPAFQ
jgi:hypothetical protein